jgi:hypothetical protein
MTVIAGLLNFGRLLYSSVFAYAFLSNGFFLVCFLLSSLFHTTNLDAAPLPPTSGPLGREYDAVSRGHR